MESLPQVGDTIEVYSLSAKTWAPAVVKAVTDVKMELGIYDVVVEYTVSTEEIAESASSSLLGNADTDVKRMKKVAVFDQQLCRSYQTGQPFEPGGHAAVASHAAVAPEPTAETGAERLGRAVESLQELAPPGPSEPAEPFPKVGDFIEVIASSGSGSPRPGFAAVSLG